MKGRRGFQLIELMIIVVIGAIITAIVVGGVGCIDTEGSKDTDASQAEKTKKLTAEIARQVGMPNLVNFQQKKLMKMVYELCDKEDLVCYAYIKSDYHGKLMFIGKCIGFGIPFSAQYTNPERVAHQRMMNGGSFGTLPQADPNGLFMPTSSSATWLMMIDPKGGEPRPVYIEPEIVVSPFPLHG